MRRAAHVPAVRPDLTADSRRRSTSTHSRTVAASGIGHEPPSVPIYQPHETAQHRDNLSISNFKSECAVSLLLSLSLSE